MQLDYIDTQLPFRGLARGLGGRLRRSKHTNANDVELETTLQELALNLLGDAVETDMTLGVDGRRGSGRHCRGWFLKMNRIELSGR